MPKSSDQLLATCWTTAGDAAPDRVDQSSPLGLAERAAAASAAGFTGFGLVYADLLRYEQEHGVAGMKSILDDNGLTYVEVEALADWWTTGPRRTASDRVRGNLLRYCEALGAHHIKIHGDAAADAPLEFEHWAGELAQLAGEAESVGAKVGIEFLPFSNIRTVHEAVRLAEAAGHPATGVVIDVWHTERAGTPASDLALIPLDRIIGVELNDAAAEPVGTLFEDTVHRRLLCGQGAFDLPGVVRALRQAGWNGPWGAEILADDFRKLPVSIATQLAFESTSALLARP